LRALFVYLFLFISVAAVKIVYLFSASELPQAPDIALVEIKHQQLTVPRVQV